MGNETRREMAALLELYNNATNTIDGYLEKAKDDYPVLKRFSEAIENMTGIRSSILVVAAFLGPIFCYFMPFILESFMLCYAMFRSITSIEKGDADRTRWLAHWLIFYGVELVDSSPLGWTLRHIVPGFNRFFTPLKMLFTFWCIAPIKVNGSDVIYRRFRPTLLQWVGMVDVNVDCINKVVGKNKGVFMDHALNAATVLGREMNRTV